MRDDYTLLIAHKKLPGASEAEVGNTARHQDLAKQPARRIPHFNAIEAACVDVAFSVTLDAIGNTCVGHGEYSSVGEKLAAGTLDHVEGIAEGCVRSAC